MKSHIYNNMVYTLSFQTANISSSSLLAVEILVNVPVTSRLMYIHKKGPWTGALSYN